MSRSDRLRIRQPRRPADRAAALPRTATTAITAADLSITNTASAPLPHGGQNITYTIVVANAGPDTATGVTMTDVLPAGSTFVSAAPSGICSGTGTIICSVGTLSDGDSSTITLVIAAPLAGGLVSNTATVTADQPDPNPANSSAAATLSIQPAQAIPALSTTILLLLGSVLMLIAALKLR
jgi:large repetitive protein